MGNAGSSAPYVIGSDVSGYRSKIWTLSEGVARSDNAPVSVFRPSPAAKESHKAFAAGGARRLRVIRHPHVLSFVHAMDDGASPAPQLVALVTEPIVPLRTWLAGVHGRSWEDAASKCAWSDSAVAATAVEGCAYGLWCVATALEFLHTECGLVHGNVCVDTVFVTRGGDWRLGGVELIGDRGVWPSTALRDARAASALEAPVQPPEVESGDWKAVSAGAVHAVDSFLFGVLALQVLVDPSVATAAKLRRASACPAPLRGMLSRALGAAAGRPTLAVVLGSPFFAVPLVSTVSFLGSIALQDAPAVTSFFEGLPALLPRFPADTCLHKILPALISVAEFGSVGGSSTAAVAAAADSAAAVAGSVPVASGAAAMAGIVLPSLIAIRSRVPVEEFTSRVGACVVRLFASPERATRVALLTHIDALLPAVEDKVLNSGLFEQWAAGLSDASNVLRELTVRSVVTLAPRLSAGNLDPKLLRLLRKSLSDADPTIRVNATICVGRISNLLAKPRLEDFVLPALARGLRDPHPQSRAVAVKALTFVLPQFEAVAVALRLLPAICAATLDEADDVREGALALAGSCVDALRRAAAERPPRPAAAPAAAAPATAVAPGVAATRVFAATPAAVSIHGGRGGGIADAATPAAVSIHGGRGGGMADAQDADESSANGWADDDWGDAVPVKVIKPAPEPRSSPVVYGRGGAAADRGVVVSAASHSTTAVGSGADSDGECEAPARPPAAASAPATPAPAAAPPANTATTAGTTKPAGLKLRGAKDSGGGGSKSVLASGAATVAVPPPTATAAAAFPAPAVVATAAVVPMRQSVAAATEANEWDEWGDATPAVRAAAPSVTTVSAPLPRASEKRVGGGGAWDEWDDAAVAPPQVAAPRGGRVPAVKPATTVPAPVPTATVAPPVTATTAPVRAIVSAGVGSKPSGGAKAPAAAAAAGTAAKPVAGPSASGWDWGDDGGGAEAAQVKAVPADASAAPVRAAAVASPARVVAAGAGAPARAAAAPALASAKPRAESDDKKGSKAIGAKKVVVADEWDKW